MIKIKDYVSPVIEWRNAFQLPVRSNWEGCTDEELDLSVKLIKEELNEYVDALKSNDDVEIVDALVDTIFVTTQLLNVLGVDLDIAHYSDKNESLITLKNNLLYTYNNHKDNKLKLASITIDILCLSYDKLRFYGDPDSFIKEVYDSNMSKLCNNEDDAKKSVEKYNKLGINTYYKLVGDNYIIYRTDDHKVLKGIHFKTPNLKPLMNK